MCTVLLPPGGNPIANKYIKYKPQQAVIVRLGWLATTEYKRMDSASVISLTECNTGTTQKLSSGVVTTIDLQIERLHPTVQAHC
jgi:hypothetical protein